MLARRAIEGCLCSREGGWRGPLASISLRGYERALVELADLVVRGDADDGEIETRLRRVQRWARQASELHGASCARLAELTEQKRRLIGRVVRERWCDVALPRR